MFYRLLALCFALCVGAAAAPSAFAAGDDLPAWLREAASAGAPAYKRDVPAVVLRDEGVVTVSEDGRVTTTSTYAVRILTREGRAYASAEAAYSTATDKVREMRAWLIRPDGTLKRYDKDDIVDSVADLDDVYDETHVKKISAADAADAGAVFGYQITTEERAVFPQTVWYFQGLLPVLVSRYTVTLPAGWRAASVTFNHERIEPSVGGTSYTWELRNLAPIEVEPASPSVRNIAPRLAVSYAPAVAGAATRAFDKWADVSRWYSELSDAQAEPNEAIRAKALELTAGAKTELEKIQAVGRYVQGLQYISVQIGVGRYRPHAAAEVFAKSYGDCKDKANLMRAMLRALKMQSYPVLIYLGDRTYVREEWASPNQFNHCIIAVKVGDETQAATVVQHPTLGRLLIFDATDESTPVGDLPEDEQGSFALVAAGDSGALLRMPSTPPEANRFERQTEVSLAADGAITASVRDRFVGQSAVTTRRRFKGLSRADFTKMIERWVTQGASGAHLSKIEPADNHAENRFALDVEFTAANYAQSMQDRLLVFKPAVVSRYETLYLTDEKRAYPVVLGAVAYTETVRVKLPDGFEVDEMPDPLKLDLPFGSYAATYEVKDGQLLFTRTLTQRAATIPPEQYASVRNFYARIRAAEQAPVVLAKK